MGMNFISVRKTNKQTKSRMGQNPQHLAIGERETDLCLFNAYVLPEYLAKETDKQEK